MHRSASLPMYDWPELRQKTNLWWQALARNFTAEGLDFTPKALNGHEQPHDDWRDPNLFLSQTCGYPLRYEFQGVLEVVAVPRYKTEGCEGAYYSSMVVVRKGDSRLSLADFGGRRAAYNVENSQSGYSSLRAVIAPVAQGSRFFSRTIKTGAHLNSMKAVAGNEADICAIDCVSWGLAKRVFPDLVAALGVIDQSPLAPALPYVTAKSCSKDDLKALRRGLLKAVEDEETRDIRADLLLDGFDILPSSVFERIDEIEKAAIDAGYPRLQ